MFNILIAILTIQLVIFVHELGHFLVAKKLGIDVYEFCVGFGPKIFSFKKNETVYTLRAIPLLGHVLFDDIDELENKEANDIEKNNSKPISTSENHIKNKGYLAELAVYLSGPFFNFLAAFIVLCGMYIYSGFPSTTIHEVVLDSPAYIAGIESGDTIVQIENVVINKWEDISTTINKLKKDSINIKVKNSENQLKTIVVEPKYDKDTDFYSIGVSPLFKKDIFKSIGHGFESTINNIIFYIEHISDLILNLFTKNNNQNVELSGPIGTIQVISEQSKESMSSLISMFVALNINIGVINLIPFIPVLDGGQATIRTFEALSKKKLNENLNFYIKLSGAVVLIGIMIFTTFKDIVNLF